ncbi:MAG: sensor histidine kinase [Chitinispirillaceae bacterium]|nr:sensor histidine kinase [Chitinispirillaceae bacterium]
MEDPISDLLLENVSKPLAFFDTEGIIIRTNRAWELLLCEPSDALLILSYDDLVEQLHLPPFDAMQMKDSCQATFNRKSIVVTRHRILLKKNSGIMIEIDDFTSVEEKKTLIDSTITDIMQKIRSRIASIQNVLTLLVEYPDDQFSQETSSLLCATRKEMWNLSRHTENLRDLTALNSGAYAQQIHPEHFDLRELLEIIRIEAAPVLPPGTANSLFRFPTVKPLPIFNDRHICHHAIATIVFNALVYSDTISPVTVSISEEGTSALLITVEDSGWGIPHEEQKNIFSYGFRSAKTLRADIAGLGVGLFLSRKMLSMVNSEIWFTSKPGSGSQFTILLREFESHDQ